MATPTLDEYLAKAKPLNPEYSDNEIAQEYQTRYGSTRPASAMTTFADFLPKAKAVNPDYSDDEIRSYWEQNYANRGAREKDPSFGKSFVEGAKGGYQSLKASGAGSFERLQDPQSQWHKVGDDAAKAFEEEASKHAAPEELQKQPWYKQLTNKEYLANFLGDVAVQSAPSLGGAVAGGLVGGVPGAMAGMAAVTYFQQAGSTYREAIKRYQQQGLSEQDAHAKAYQDSGISGLASAAVNALSIPASLVAPFAKRLSNLFLQYSLNVGVDTADQITQNAVAQKTFAPERSLSEGVPHAIVASSALGAPETMIAAKAIAPAKAAGPLPTVTERQPEDLGIETPALTPEVLPPAGPRQLTGPPEVGEIRDGKVFGGGPVIDVSPIPDVSSVTNASTLDEAIANAVGVVQGATETAKARAAEFAKMTAKAKNDADAVMARAPEKRSAIDVPILPGPTATEPGLLDQPSPIVPGQVFTPRIEPEVDPRQALADERARMIARREEQRALTSQPQEQPEMAQEGTIGNNQAFPQADAQSLPQDPARQPDKPLPTARQVGIEKAYPSVQDLHSLASQKGLDIEKPVFRELTKMSVGKEHLDDLSPVEREKFAQALNKIKASEPAKPVPPPKVDTPAPQVDLTPVEQSPSPVTSIPESQTPRSELSTVEEAQATQVPESAAKFQNVPRGSKKEGSGNEDLSDMSNLSGRTERQPSRVILPGMQEYDDEGVQGKPPIDQGAAIQGERQKLRARLQGQGENNQEAVPGVRIRESGNAPQGLQQADDGGLDVPKVPPRASRQPETSSDADVTPKEVRALIHAKGVHLDTPAFKEYLEKVTGKKSFLQLKPEDLKTLKDSLDGLEAQKETPPTQEFELTAPKTTAGNVQDKPKAEPVSTEPAKPSVSDRMYADMWKKVQRGFVKEDGEKSLYLDAAKRAKAKGALKEQAELRPFIERVSAVVSPKLSAKEQQRAIDRVIDEQVKAEEGAPQFDERDSGRAAPTPAQFAQGMREGLSIPGTDQQLVDTSQEFPKELMKQLSTKRYVRQLTTELNRAFNAMKRVLVGTDPVFQNISFAALSPDSYYYGVNNRGPDQVVMNPWASLHKMQLAVREGAIAEDQVPEYLAGHLVKTLVHEFTHQQVITTHEDERAEHFDRMEVRNRAILGTRLAMLQRQLMAVLTGGENGTVSAIRSDLRQQQAFWKKGDGLSSVDQSVSSEPTYARRRQSVSGEGASGRTGPPENLRDGGKVSPESLDESPELRGSRPVTDSPAFKSWFKNSKVVDENGKPLVVYHGTPYTFDQFEGNAHFFSSEPGSAATFGNDRAVMPVYLQIQKPADRAVLNKMGIEPSKLNEPSSKKDVKRLQLAGYDGVIVEYRRGVTTYVAFKPEQIKSATGNRGTFDPNDARIQFSKREEETGTINPTKAREQLEVAGKATRPYLLGALGLEQISQVYGKDHAEVRQYNKATQAMEADFVEMSRGSEQVVKSWTALKVPVADTMAKVMEDARFLNFDPDPKKNQEADSQKKKDLRTRFAALPDDAKSTYRLARDFYTDMAEKRFQALKERIERAGGTPENTKKLVDRLQLAYEQVRSKVYFPFTRFGENIVVAKQMKDGKETDREVHAFESVAEAQQFATLMKMKGWTVKQTVAKQYSLDKEGPASKIVRQMHDIIKELDNHPGVDGTADTKEFLLDSLNQSFLQALPDMSYAKHFIHAKDVKGASKDALRAFAHSALHGAHHISRIKHADRLTDALSKLDERINETAEGDVTEARQVFNELVNRHNEILNPSTHPVSAWLGQLGFTMSLGGVVATGVTNATQVPLITYPWLGARFGFGKASAALARAYKDFLDPKTLNKDSLFDVTKSARISESERKMLLELARRGRIDLTQTMDLAGLSAQDNLSRVARQIGTTQGKVMRMLGFTFHAPEVMNRQVTALASYRLEKERGGSAEEALQRAEQAIIDTHFIYTAENRPRYMSGNFLRVLTMFKQYSQNIAFLYGRAASIWLDKNNATKEERAIAKSQLLSMLALQFGAAGALGMPFFGAATDLLMSVVGAFDDDDEKRDWEVALRKWLAGGAASLYEAVTGDKAAAEEFGKSAGEVISHGASRLTPWDMANRLGQQDLFVRAPQREREGRQAAMDWFTSLGGPVPGYLTNAFLGVQDVAKGIKDANLGFFMRGVEELTPAVLRHGVKSLRYAIEDVRTRDQYKQLELRPEETLGQFFGFTPSRVAEMYESTTAVKNKEHRVLNQRKGLMERFSRAVQDRDAGARKAVLEDIREFNSRNRMFGITSDTLNRSMKARMQHERGMERGMFLPPKRRELLSEGDFGDF